MKEKKTENDSNEKLFWMIGIALIVFLVLVLISVLILKSTREKANSLTDGFHLFGNQTNNVNYEISESGEKRNTSSAIASAQFDFGDIRFSKFSIVEVDKEDDISGEEAGVVNDIYFQIENLAQEEKGNESYFVTLFDEKGETIKSFTIRLEKIPAGGIIQFRQNSDTPCVNAAKIDVQRIDEVSGE